MPNCQSLLLARFTSFELSTRGLLELAHPKDTPNPMLNNMLEDQPPTEEVFNPPDPLNLLHHETPEGSLLSFTIEQRDPPQLKNE
jgi:hypothetical protein